MKDRGWQYTAATVLLTMLIVVGWCMVDVLRKITDYSIMWNPPEAAEIMRCCVYGLIAVASALKLDIPFLGELLKGDLSSVVAKLKGGS